jgi:hypothetical protein
VPLALIAASELSAPALFKPKANSKQSTVRLANIRGALLVIPDLPMCMYFSG